METIQTWSVLNRKKHAERLFNSLVGPLSSEYEKLVPAQTWAVYWITHSLALLDQKKLLESISKDVIQFIGECQHEEGGYAGGPGQIAHLATTFGAVSALVTLDNEAALDSIDRVKLVKFLHRMKQEDGSFTLHDDGEIDSRASYCALAVLRLLNIRDPNLLENVAEWVLSCQTYEGGFASVPGSEAHGGYSFCCVASLCLLDCLGRADLSSLLRWLVHKQIDEEGGFCGRSNKLVDSCYSYWQGAIFPLIHSYLEADYDSSDSSDSSDSNATRTQKKGESMTTRSQERVKSYDRERLFQSWLYDAAGLQDYILNKCQAKAGLLRDKPSATPDVYHTCYALSGLSLSQHQPDGNVLDIGSKQTNILATTNPLFNVTNESLADCFQYFKNKKIEIEVQTNKA